MRLRANPFAALMRRKGRGAFVLSIRGKPMNSTVRVIAAAFCLAVAASQPAAAEICTRLPLSDVAFGKEASTNVAREKLAGYAAETLKKRGWSGAGPLRKSNETVSCKVYLNLGPLGTEYQCLVTATFCGR
jgi:hypothetical protein